MSSVKTIYRYSLAFKQKVVSEIESGQFTLSQAYKFYDIPGRCTIQKWIKKFGKNHLLSKVVRIELPDEKDRIQALKSRVTELERQKQELESALAQAHLKELSLEALIACVSEHFQTDVKKNFGTDASEKHSNTHKINTSK